MKKPSRLYVESPLAAGAAVALSAAQSHYVFNVLRLKMGGQILLFNGKDGEWAATLEAFTKAGCTCKPSQQTRPQSTGPSLWLYFAPIKRGHLEYVVEKASELGVSVLQPVITQHTQMDHINRDRLRAIAIEAAEQCERLSIPDVREAIQLKQAVAAYPKDRALLFCAEAGETQPVATALQAPAPQSLSWQNAAVIIGPEGGFSKDELILLGGLPQAVAVSLGPRILRADTAAIAALSCLQALCGDWAGKAPVHAPYTANE